MLFVVGIDVRIEIRLFTVEPAGLPAVFRRDFHAAGKPSRLKMIARQQLQQETARWLNHFPPNWFGRWTPTGGRPTTLSVGQIYLYDNPLLKEPLRHEHIKPRLLGHWGTTPGLNFIYVHLNRVDQAVRPERDLHHRARPRRARHRGQHLPGRHLQRSSTRTSRRTNRG